MTCPGHLVLTHALALDLVKCVHYFRVPGEPMTSLYNSVSLHIVAVLKVNKCTFFPSYLLICFFVPCARDSDIVWRLTRG